MLFNPEHPLIKLDDRLLQHKVTERDCLKQKRDIIWSFKAVSEVEEKEVNKQTG